MVGRNRLGMDKASRAQPRGRPRTRASEDWVGYFAVWLGAGVMLIVLGVAIMVAVDHGRRLAAFAVFGGILCLALASLVHRARRNSGL